MRCCWAVTALVVLFAGSCGQGGTDSAETEPPGEIAERPSNDGGSRLAAILSNTCSLIDDPEMSDLLPNPVAGSILGPGLCEYAPVDLSVGRVNVELFVQDVAATGCDLFFSVGGFDNAEPVDGIGAAARWKAHPKQIGLCVDGAVALAVTLYDPDNATDARATARAVGELAISRL